MRKVGTKKCQGIDLLCKFLYIYKKTNYMVYFIGNEQFIKIGYSRNIDSLKSRISNLRVGNPLSVEIFLIIDGNLNKEKELHRKFKQYKSNGEWFINSEDIKKFIAENETISLYSRTIKNESNLTLKDLRKIKNLSLQEVGEKLNITKQSAKESEDRFLSESITIKNLKTYANALGFNVHINFSQK